MGDLSDNFSRWEFACQCGKCNSDTVDAELIIILERVREWADDSVTINSGMRCTIHNRSEGGGKNSQHLRGRAADIVVKGKTPHQVYRRLEDWYPYEYGIGRYKTFTHIDSRNARARWVG